MPFTFSHPAIVLPLTYLSRKWFSLTGLVVGSLTPDFEFFIRMRLKGLYGHTWHGVLWFDLPIGLALAFLFHNIVRNSLLNNLPAFVRSRFPPDSLVNWNHYFKNNAGVVILSILLGAVSHIFWDSFTHSHGYFVQQLPALANTLTVFNREIPIFKILQHGSTLAGAFVIAVAIYQLPTHAPTQTQVGLKYWSTIIILTIIIILARVASGLDYMRYGHMIATAISAGMIALVLTSVLQRTKE